MAKLRRDEKRRRVEVRIKTKLRDPKPLLRTKNDFIVQPFRASGPGGQHRNKVSTAIRITDKKTGISSEATDSRSQSDNKSSAFRKLIYKLIEHYEKLESNDSSRNLNLGWAEKVRTYHGERDEVIDHRSEKRARYSDVLNGDLDLVRYDGIEGNIE